MTAALTAWALPQISRLLPLDQESLQQIISYTDSLPKEAAAEHLKNLLGDTPQALEFISSFNSRRQAPPLQLAAPTSNASSVPANASTGGVPRNAQRQPKKKKNIHALPPRQIQEYANPSGSIVKRDDQDYMGGAPRQRKQKEPPLANVLALNSRPEATQLPVPTAPAGLARNPSPKAPPSASGPLISDSLAPPRASSRTASPAPTKTKVAISGGTNMHGASSTLSDLDSAIRSLELQTNPSLTEQATSPTELAKRRCNCMATRHPLLSIAPNCTACGKIICVKEGLGPCTFCATPLLSAQEIASIVRVLKDERGAERQKQNNAAHKRAEVSVKPRAFTGRDFLSSTAASASPSPLSSAPASAHASDVDTDDGDDGSGSGNAGLVRAKEHRDRLLGFQTQNARRTRIHDEAADFDVPAAGTNMWASPAERALQLKKQQKALREMEWNARPEWEKRRVVASIDVAGGRVVRRMAEVERPVETEEEEAEEDADGHVLQGDGAGGNKGEGGAFSRNPLMGALIRPVARAEKGAGKGKGADGDVNGGGIDGTAGAKKQSMWRRVQDDNEDNEAWILDGGVYGGRTEDRALGAEEHAFG